MQSAARIVRTSMTARFHTAAAIAIGEAATRAALTSATAPVVSSDRSAAPIDAKRAAATSTAAMRSTYACTRDATRAASNVAPCSVTVITLAHGPVGPAA